MPARCTPATCSISPACFCATARWRSTGTTNCWRRRCGRNVPARRQPPRLSPPRKPLFLAVAGWRGVRRHPGFALFRRHCPPFGFECLAFGVVEGAHVGVEGSRLGALFGRHVLPAPDPAVGVLALFRRHLLPALRAFEQALALFGFGVPALADRSDQSLAL